MKATVKIVHPAVRAIQREAQCAVRLGLQGWGSVELCVDELRLWPSDPRFPSWRTLAELMAHPAVHSVTFSGPWTPESELERSAGDRDRWQQLGVIPEEARG